MLVSAPLIGYDAARVRGAEMIGMIGEGVADLPLQFIAGGAVVALLVINITFVLSLLKAYREKDQDQGKEVTRLTTECANLRTEVGKLNDEANKARNRHWRCEQRTNILVWTLQQHSIPVPETIWQQGEED